MATALLQCLLGRVTRAIVVIAANSIRVRFLTCAVFTAEKESDTSMSAADNCHTRLLGKAVLGKLFVITTAPTFHLSQLKHMCLYSTVLSRILRGAIPDGTA